MVKCSFGTLSLDVPDHRRNMKNGSPVWHSTRAKAGLLLAPLTGQLSNVLDRRGSRGLGKRPANHVTRRRATGSGPLTSWISGLALARRLVILPQRALHSR